MTAPFTITRSAIIVAPAPAVFVHVKWQIVPTVLVKLLRDNNPAKASAAMQAMLKMGKLDIAGLQWAYDQA